MSLGDELRHMIGAYLRHEIDADALFGKLASAAAEALNLPGDEPPELWSAAFGALSELSSGEIDEAEVRRQLRALVAQHSQAGAFA